MALDGSSGLPGTNKVPSRSRWNGTALNVVNGGTLFATFPVELRVEVFLQFCGAYCPIGDPNAGPLPLLRICRAWTQLALQTPQLWSSFAVDSQPLLGTKRNAFLISTMKTWIDRSRNLPLSFKLHYPVPDATCADLVRSILPSVGRWRDVTLCAPGASLLPIWEAEPNSHPCLRTLTIETLGPDPVVLHHLGINWAQLTEVDLFLVTVPTLDECFYVLKESVHLRRCSLNAGCWLRSGELERLSLPNLEHLQLKMYRGGPEADLLIFLRALSLPRLNSLRIDWNMAPHPWSKNLVEAFIDFLEEVRGHLASLHLAHLPFNGPQFIECLRVVPALTSLGISSSQGDRQHDFIDDRFLDALTQRPGSDDSGLVPLLQHLRLESHGESFSNVALFRLLASRWKFQESPPGPLEGLDIVSPKRHAEYRPRRFKDLKEGRLDVKAGLRVGEENMMLKVISSFMTRDSYGQKLCFMNGDFPSSIRPLLMF
ncbi:hypothetical protein C8R46DRAFT_1187780 [Mycena filopes]|nr:hypothetical protein C8R46DRAFT_1187780 [Mycena filopes]